VKRRRFRGDLFHRINTITVKIPPLRERPQDIEALIAHFSRVYSGVQFTDSAIRKLTSYAWPGNVRELKNLVERFSIVSSSVPVTDSMLPEELSKTVQEEGQQDSLERTRLRKAIRDANGNVSLASRKLNIPRTTLIYRIKKLGLA